MSEKTTAINKDKIQNNGRKGRGMITITMSKWFAISLTIYLVLDIIAKVLNEIENKLNREHRQLMKEFTEEERTRRWIEEWKAWKKEAKAEVEK